MWRGNTRQNQRKDGIMHKKPKKMKRMMDGGVAAPQTTTAQTPAPTASPAPRRGAEYFANKYSKLAAANPGYKPTLASPVDSISEFRDYRKGLQDYLRANRPARGPRGSGGTAPTTPAPTTPAPTKPPKSISEKKLTPAEMRRAFGPMFAIGGPMYPMRGGGLARKGVGQALAKGGLVKANGCAQRGKTRGKIV